VRLQRFSIALVLVCALAGCKAYTEGSSRTIGEFTDDVGIQSSVKMVLINDDEIKGMNINVEVRKGVVSLYGRVPTEAQRKKAVDLVGRVKGVKQVEDRLTLVPE
jgi:osmotically-inducible protein OsmY